MAVLDPATRHTVVHHSSTSTYIPNFIQIEETVCGRTDGQMYGRTDGRTFSPYIIRSTFGSRPKKWEGVSEVNEIWSGINWSQPAKQWIIGLVLKSCSSETFIIPLKMNGMIKFDTEPFSNYIAVWPGCPMTSHQSRYNRQTLIHWQCIILHS